MNVRPCSLGSLHNGFCHLHCCFCLATAALMMRRGGAVLKSPLFMLGKPMDLFRGELRSVVRDQLEWGSILGKDHAELEDLSFRRHGKKVYIIKSISKNLLRLSGCIRQHRRDYRLMLMSLVVVEDIKLQRSCCWSSVLKSRPVARMGRVVRPPPPPPQMAEGPQFTPSALHFPQNPSLECRKSALLRPVIAKLPPGSMPPPDTPLAVEHHWCFGARIMMSEKVHFQTNTTPRHPKGWQRGTEEVATVGVALTI